MGKVHHRDPCGTAIRMKGAKGVEYYLLDGREAVRLKGKRAKTIGANTWGYHYVREDTGERVVSVVYYGGRFLRA